MTYRESEPSQLASPPPGKVRYLVREIGIPLNAGRVDAQFKWEAWKLANLATVPRPLGFHEVEILELNEDGSIKVEAGE